MSETSHVAIIGGGFSGTLVAVHLLRQNHPVHIDLIDPRAAGRGLAYSTIWDDHLLNVPAVRMSAFGSEPMHFLNWLHANGKPTAPPDWFAPRKLYGSYIQDVLQQAISGAHPQSQFRQHYSEAVGLFHDGLQANVALKNGKRVRAEKVVLACGNPSPRPVANPLAGYFGSPWTPGSFADLNPDRPVLLVGAGLTAVDAFLALESQGHRGMVYMVSRRGKIPHVHTFYRPLTPPPPQPAATGARALFRSLREQVIEAGKQDVDWRAVVDSLRPITNELWQKMELAEQRRILRHLKTWWDIHRHRMAPAIGARVAAARERGQLKIHAGRVRHMQEAGDNLNVRVALRSGRETTFEVARAINCTGPDEDYRRIPNPLVESLRDSGRISPNFVGKGVRTDSYGALIDTDGVTTEWLLTLGPPRLGGLFETTAVPELRKQAEALAAYLAAVILEPVEVPVELYLAAGI